MFTIWAVEVTFVEGTYAIATADNSVDWVLRVY